MTILKKRFFMWKMFCGGMLCEFFAPNGAERNAQTRNSLSKSGFSNGFRALGAVNGV